MDDPTRICTSICVKSARELERALNESETNLVEFRLDCLEASELDGEQLRSLIAKSNKEVILTFRPYDQGGSRTVSVQSRAQFWKQLGHPPNTFLDLELDLCSDRSVLPDDINWQRVICSHHDFAGVPADLDSLYSQMLTTPARILKIALAVSCVSECLPIFQLIDRAHTHNREMIAIGMGQAGVPTRVLTPSRGAFLTYAACAEGHETAAGQLTTSDLRHVYRIDQITRATKMVGLVGRPTSHSISPHVHNAAFESIGFDATYLPFETRNLQRFTRDMVDPRTRLLDWNAIGLSVTAPYKSDIMSFLDDIDSAADEIGAVNTVVIDEQGLHGYNTDAIGFLKPLLERSASIKDANCAVIGAGGAARTAVWVLQREGAQVHLFARNIERGQRLASEFAITSRGLDDARFNEFDLVVNATPLGTRGEFESLTVARSEQLHGAGLAYDLVYNPSETQFLREAEKAGVETLGGLPMLVTQATEQFRLWTGMEAPLAVMRTTAERKLAEK